jgi:hypothetical protein
VRRIALIAAVALLATAATAWAVTNTVSYSVTIKKASSAKPTKAKPVNMAYNAVLHIDTDPPGSQPDTAPTTTIFFAGQIKPNAKLVPSCKQSEIDGQTTFPAKCNKAKVGSGTARALAGSPGSPSSNSVTEDLNVTAVNGEKGRKILLVLNSQPGAPVAITNRVVPGTISAASGSFATKVTFEIPADLQNQLGLSISLTDFKVGIVSKAFTVKVRGVTKRMAYLQLKGACPSGKIPVRAVAAFKDSNGQTTNVTNDSTAKC